MRLGTYSPRTYSLAQPILDFATDCVGWDEGPEDTNISVFGVGDLQTGNLQARATDFGPRNPLITLVLTEVPRTLILMYLSLATYYLRPYSLAHRIWDLATHSLRWLGRRSREH